MREHHPARLRQPGRARWGRVVTGLASAWTLIAATACSDPYELDWFAVQDTAVLYSLEHPRHNVHDAFDFANGLAVVLEGAEATGTWDVAVGSDANGLVLLPPGALGVASDAGIAVFVGVRFDDVGRAPSDSTSFITRSPIQLQLGSTYVIRSRAATDYYGTTTCSFYAKMEPISIEPEDFRVQFIYTVNPNCHDLRLTP